MAMMTTVPLSLIGATVLFSFLSLSLYSHVLVGPGDRYRNRVYLTRHALAGFLHWAATVLLPTGAALLLGALVCGGNTTGLAVSYALSALLIVFLSRPTFYRTVRGCLRFWRMARSSASSGFSAPWALSMVPLLVAPMGVGAMSGNGAGVGAGSSLGFTSLLLPLLGLMMAGGAQRGAVLGPNVKPWVKEAVEKMRAGVEELDLSWKGLDDNDARVLAEELKVNASLTKLHLDFNLVGDAGAQAIAEALKGNTTLSALGLSHNWISDAGAQALAEALKVNASLTKLHLFDNQIGSAGAQALADALEVNAALTTLNLFHNQIGPAGAQALAEALKGDTTLTELDLTRNQIGDAGAQAIAEALKGNTSLTELDLNSNQIGPAGAQALAEALKVNTSLTKLDLEANQIGPASAQAIAEALKINASLTSLVLFNNAIGPAGAQAIAEALKFTSSLMKLFLFNNQIGAAGAQAIAEALKSNTSLMELDLRHDKIFDAGAQALAEALKVNASLTLLDLGGNKIGAVGAQALAEALKVNPSLTALKLNSNQIGDAGGQAILSACSSLTLLDLSSNGIRHIPLAFLNNTRLNEFRCHSNPWVSPPPEVVNKGLAAIRHHLFLMEREGTVRCKTGRLMVVGVAEAGKTSLFKALDSRDDRTDPIAKNNRTPLYASTSHTVKLATKDTELDLTGLEINVCDFAGQREYAVVHQLFLTSRAIYLLVFDASKPLDLATDADPWLDSIQAKSPGARVIIIATHADECSRDELDERCSGFANHIVRRLVFMQNSSRGSGSSATNDLKSCPRVHGINLSSPPADGDFGAAVLRVSSTHGRGIKEARLAIIGELAKLDAIEMWIPTSYDTLLRFIIEKRLTTSSLVHHLPDLHKEMSLHLLFCDAALPLDEFKAALSFWHDVGEVYVFHDQVFVDRSSFLFKLVKSIAMSADEVEKKIKNPLLNAHSKADLIRLKDRGELTRPVLFGCLWAKTADKDEFPEADRPNFIRLLEDFDVLYPVSKDLWLVPALVPDKPVPEELLDRFDRLPNHFVRRVTIPFRPFALLQRLHTDIPRGFEMQMAVSWGLVVKKNDLCEAALYNLHTAAEVFSKDQFDSGKVGPHHLDQDDAVSVITVRASSLDMLRTVLDGVLKLLERFEFGAKVWVPLQGKGSPRDGLRVTHLRVCGIHRCLQGNDTLKQTHGPGYSTWRAKRLPSGLMDLPLGFADLEPRRASSAPLAPSQSGSGLTSTPRSFSARPSFYSMVRNQLFVTPSSRREALEVLELVRPLFGPLFTAVENLHRKGGHLLGDPVSGQVKVDPRHVSWDHERDTVAFELSSLPVLAVSAGSAAPYRAQDLAHVQRLLAFVLLKCEWDAAFVSKPLADIATDLEAAHWLEAADLLRTSFTSLDELRHHPFFWSLARASGLMATFGEEMGKLPRPSTDRDDMESLASEFAGVPDLDWSCLPPVLLRHLGYVPPEGTDLQRVLRPFAPRHEAPTERSPAYKFFFDQLNKKVFNCYLRHSGVRCPLEEHIEAFDAVYKPNPSIEHKCAEDKCKVKCDGFKNCRPEPWRFTALAEQVRHALVHCPHWMNFAASDVAAVEQLLGLPAGKAITDETVVRWLVWPDASASLPPYLARGGYLMLIVRILRAIKGQPLGDSFKGSLAKLEG